MNVSLYYVVAVSVYLVKFLIELCLLAKSLTETTDIVKKSISEPFVRADYRA